MRSTIHRASGLLSVVAALCILVGGCKQSGEESKSSKTGRQRPDINALRGMPYAGSAEADEDEDAGVVLRDQERSCPGYNLYTLFQLFKVDLIDEAGEVMNAWTVEKGECIEHSELLPNGDLLVIGADKHDWGGEGTALRVADEDRYILRLNWEGDLLWKRMLPVHHDVTTTPAGNFLTLRLVRRPVPRIHAHIDVCDVHLTMLNEKGQVLESHSVLDAIDRNPTIFPLDLVQPDTLGGPEWVDLFHANSIEWIQNEHLVGKHQIYDPGNILVCFRHQNRIAVINWGTNQVVWAWGRDTLDGPHDAQMLANGHVLLFDNGLGRGYSRVLEIDPVTEKIVWEYKADPLNHFFTPTKGSVQRLPNGNTLVAESDRARAFEITAEGEHVWYFKCPYPTDLTGDKVWILDTKDNVYREVDTKDVGFSRATFVRMKRYSHEFVETIVQERRAQTQGD